VRFGNAFNENAAAFLGVIFMVIIIKNYHIIACTLSNKANPHANKTCVN